MYHPSTTHNYCMIPPSLKVLNSNPSPISLLCLAVLTQHTTSDRGGLPPFFSDPPPQKKILKFKILNPKLAYICMKIHPNPFPPLNTLGPQATRNLKDVMMAGFSLLTSYRTWWYWAVYICPFSVIVVNQVGVGIKRSRITQLY